MVKIEQSNGTISITNEVFTNLAGDAATSCFGVKGMVGRSKDSGPFQLLRRESMSKGVNATFADDGSISLELHIAVDHGVNISALATASSTRSATRSTRPLASPWRAWTCTWTPCSSIKRGHFALLPTREPRFRAIFIPPVGGVQI